MMSTLGPAYKEYTGSCLWWVHWVLLTKSTLGPANNKQKDAMLRPIYNE